MTEPGFQILYEEGPCLIVAKPGGLLTQAPRGIDSLEHRIKQFLQARGGGAEGQAAEPYLGIPHRLDRPVSGAMVFALTHRAARRMAKQFERRQVGKTYWALVEGRVRPTEGTWTDYLRKFHGLPQAEVVAADHPEGRHAVLHYRVIGEGQHGSWLEIELETGRTHQIRVQAASRGHPLLGDALYGARVTFGEQFEDERLRLIALHARNLSFSHPISREPVSLDAPPPGAWEGEIQTQQKTGN